MQLTGIARLRFPPWWISRFSSGICLGRCWTFQRALLTGSQLVFYQCLMKVLFVNIVLLNSVCIFDFIVEIALHVYVLQLNSRNDYSFPESLVIFPLWRCQILFNQQWQATLILVVFMPPIFQELVPWKEESLTELGDTVGIVCFLSCQILKNLDLLLGLVSNDLWLVKLLL